MWDLSGRTTAFIISHLYVLRQSTGAIRADRHQRLDIDQALIVPCTICAGQQWSTCAVGACVQPGLSSDLWELHGQRVHFASSRLLVALHAATKPRQPANRSGEISSRMWSHCWRLCSASLGTHGRRCCCFELVQQYEAWRSTEDATRSQSSRHAASSDGPYDHGNAAFSGT